MSNHTPEPWTIVEYGKNMISPRFTIERQVEEEAINGRKVLSNVIADVYQQESDDETEANAHLINTSPETLAELKRLRGVVVEMVTHALHGTGLKPGDVDIDMQKTDYVIAKAENRL